MTNEHLIEILKMNLGKTTGTWDKYLYTLLNAARAGIKREGITIEDTPDDDNLIIMYAAYLFRKRAEDTATMPRMLRYALNNRLFAEKGAVNPFSPDDFGYALNNRLFAEGEL